MIEQKAKNPHAQALGRMGKGKPKRFSAVEIERRRVRLAAGRVKRLEGLRKMKGVKV